MTNQNDNPSLINRDVLAEVLSNFIDALKKAEDDFSTSLFNTFNNLVEIYKDSQISQEEKERILDLSRKLADEQMIATLDEDVAFFENFKCTSKNIKTFYNRYSKGEEFSYLISELKESEKIDKRYLLEAIKNYKHKSYMSCAMLLLSIIDARFLLTSEDENGLKRKLTSTLALEKLEEIKEEKTLDFVFLIETNTLFILCNMFKHAHNFKKEPDYINRNFLFHGLSKRRIDKYDCIKLFIICSYVNYLF